MLKKRLIKLFVKVNLYHSYIEIKHIFVTLKARLIGEISIFLNLTFGIKPKNIKFFIDRSSFGESIPEYTNVLSNLDLFLKDHKKTKYRPINFHIYIIGNTLNKVLDNWFHQNVEVLIKNYDMRKSLIGEKNIKFSNQKKKNLYFFYLDKLPSVYKIYSYINLRIGNIGSYSNRFDINLNYKNLLKNNYFISLENIAKSFLSKEMEIEIQKIFKKKVVVFYDFDVDIRNDRFENINFKNKLNDFLYLRYVDNSIMIDALNELIKRDFNIVRLGRSNKEFPFKNNNFYDFAFKYNSHNEITSLDFLIPFNSTFCVTLGCGAHSTAFLYGIPTFFVGYHRFDNWQNLRNSMVLPKKFLSANNNKLIPVSELQKMEILPYSKKYWTSKKIYIKSPDKKEVLRSLMEFLNIILKRKDFSNLNASIINSWQNIYLKRNIEYQKSQKSCYKAKQKFSALVSKYELELNKIFYFK